MNTPQLSVAATPQWPPRRIFIPLLYVVIAFEIGFIWYGTSVRGAVFEQVRATLLPRPPQTVTELRTELGSLVREEQDREVGREQKLRQVTFFLPRISKLSLRVDCMLGSDEIRSVKVIHFFSEEVDLETGVGLAWMIPIHTLVGILVVSFTVAASWMALYPRLRNRQRDLGYLWLCVIGALTAYLLALGVLSFYLFLI